MGAEAAGRVLSAGQLNRALPARQLVLQGGRVVQGTLQRITIHRLESAITPPSRLDDVPTCLG